MTQASGRRASSRRVEAAASAPPANGAGEAVPVQHLRRELDDLFAPDPARYWLDFGASFTCFCGSFAIAAALPLSHPAAAPAVVVSVLALYRAVIFIHELAHFPSGRMTGFRIVWNLTCGFPLLSPAFLYATHVDHHRRQTYGTAGDGEYLPWGRPGGRLPIVGFLASSFVAMPAGLLRFGLLGPLSWLNPALRKWVAANASSLVVDLRYRRAVPSAAEEQRWRAQEGAVLLYLAALAGGLAAGIVTPALIVQLYLTVSAALLLNGLRTLAAHRYRSAGGPMTMTQQLLDSVNYPSRSLRRMLPAELWAPVGLRFHALHHLFPGIPYHNLPRAHARLAALLPPDSPYRRAEGVGLLASLRGLWRAARAEPALGVRPAPVREGDMGSAG